MTDQNDGSNARIAHVQALYHRGAYAEALDGAELLIANTPDHRDLLLTKASCLRHLRRVDDSLAVLGQLESAHPHFSLMHQERGLCHIAQKNAPAAIAALQLGVNLNPALPMSWKMLDGVYRLIGDTANAMTAAAHVATLAALPPAVVHATALFADGDIKPAENMVRAFLLQHGDHPEAMRLLAKIAVTYDALDDAETLLAGVVTMAPDFHLARLEYVSVLVQRHKHAEALAHITQLRALDAQNIDYRVLAATVAVGLGAHEDTIALYDCLLADVDNPALRADVHLWLGHALKTVGRLPEAVGSYRGAFQIRPDFGDAYWSLANLKTYRFTPDEVTAMRKQEATADIAVIDRVHLCFALGKALEDANNYAESWSYYERGNAIQRTQSRYRPELIEHNTHLQQRVCTSAFFADRAGWGVPDADPIFILGLPRAGSTLIEQILASHSQVEGTQELPNIQRIVHDLQGRDPDLDDPRYPQALVDLSREQVRALGERYLAETRVFRSGSRFFIDKMPNNFRHIGLIHLILPNAKIIDARRDPMACCFSNLKQLFAQGQEFAYSTDDIARYYRTYRALMDHWDKVLPNRVLRISHENLINNLESNVRQLLGYCGLDFEPGCVEFYNTKRSVRTPSSEQVRQPIFREGLDQWKHYAPWLGPLAAALGET